MDYAERVYALAKELHEKVYVPQAIALDYNLGPETDRPYDDLSAEGKALMQAFARFTLDAIGAAVEEIGAAKELPAKADVVNDQTAGEPAVETLLPVGEDTAAAGVTDEPTAEE